MSPDDEASLAQRRWIALRLGGGILSLVLAVLGFAFIGPWGSAPAGITLIAIAVVLQLALAVLATPLANRGLTFTQIRSSGDTWWYNHKTGEVERGPQSLGSDRDGPYATREDAARAPEIARERAAKWNAED
jgi:hypothetical protein